ncbi:MAG TPA: hypothetical protein VF576_11810 [Rubricoccaceae bacterium]
MSPDEAAVRGEVAGGPFRLGEAGGRWSAPSLVWPHLTVDVAAPARPGGPSVYAVRLDLAGYPQHAPLAVFWDRLADARLPADRWPAGTAESRTQAVFRPDWAASNHGFYAAFDRSAITTHPDWAVVHAAEAWTPDRTLTDYLDFVYDLLASPDYSGPRLPWPPDLL